EAYVALKLAGDDVDAPHMVKAREMVAELGGLENTRVFTRIWLALFGLWSWDDLPVMPPEMIFLPSWAPLNIYDWGCWARQTVVRLTIVNALKPRRPLPFGVDELRGGVRPAPELSLGTWAGRFNRLDQVLHRYERRPVKALRKRAMKKAASWIIEHQEADG